MNLKTTLSISSLAFVLLFSLNTSAQKFSDLDKSPMDVASYPSSYKEANKLLKITYSRPQLKGREFSKLAPTGKVWRTGANEAAELTLYVPMMMGDTKVPAGTYTFYLIPGKDQWTAIINEDLNVWGSYYYNESKDVARMTVPLYEADNSLEAFSIAFEEADNGVDMHLGWGKTRATVPFKK